MKLSIVTICKNDVVGLEKTYKSILSQVCCEYEWVVVDGASHDETVSFLKNVNNNKCVWITEPDESLYDAMNKGIKLSTGKFIVFLNSGDVFADENVVNVVANEISNEKRDIKLLYGSSIDVALNGQQFYRKSRNVKSYWKSMITQHQAVIFKTELLKNKGYDTKYKLSSDYALICEIITKYPNQILQLDRVICKYQLGGLSYVHRLQALKEDFEIRKSIVKLPIIVVYGLHWLHYIHHFLKKHIWWLYAKSRY